MRSRSSHENDWLVGTSRSTAAVERIHAAAAALIVRRGYDAFTIDELAARVHCSPATIYRHAGGKTAIREAVTLRASARVVDVTRNAIAELSGEERIVTAVVVALDRIRAERLDRLMGSQDERWMTSSQVVAKLAEEMLGADRPDPAAGQWLVRAVFALWRWPAVDPDAEREMVRRFLAPVLVDGPAAQ